MREAAVSIPTLDVSRIAVGLTTGSVFEMVVRSGQTSLLGVGRGTGQRGAYLGRRESPVGELLHITTVTVPSS